MTTFAFPRLGAVLVGLGLALANLVPAAAETAPETRAPAVTVAEARTREIVDRLSVTGTLVPRDEILVSPEVDGLQITEVLVEEGAKVKRGDVLARLSRDMLERQIAQQQALVDKASVAVPQAENNIEQAEAAETEARLSYERARQLMTSGSSTAAVMESRVSTLRQAQGRLNFVRNGLSIAKAELAQALAARDELRLKLARTEIRSPEDGIVSRRTARIGMTAAIGAEPLFRLISRGEIELEAEIVEAKLPAIREGVPAAIELGDGVKLPGRVRIVYPEVDRASRLGKLRIRVEPDPRLRIGSFARGEIEVARSRGVAVPQSAILYGAQKKRSVLVVKDGVTEGREVRTGLLDRADIEILSGLSDGEWVVAKAGSFLRPGDRVRPVLPDGSALEARTRATADAAGP